jgi:hypothetical protein
MFWTSWSSTIVRYCLSHSLLWFGKDKFRRRNRPVARLTDHFLCNDMYSEFQQVALAGVATQSSCGVSMGLLKLSLLPRVQQLQGHEVPGKATPFVTSTAAAVAV